MQILNVNKVENNYTFKWPDGSIGTFDSIIEYDATSEIGKHILRIGYYKNDTYGKLRRRVVVWIDNRNYAEFTGADDFDITGELLSEIRLYDDKDNKRMCRYGKDSIPERYMPFKVDSMKRRIEGNGVHDAWAVVANIADHSTMLSHAALRRYESS